MADRVVLSWFDGEMLPVARTPMCMFLTHSLHYRHGPYLKGVRAYSNADGTATL